MVMDWELGWLAGIIDGEGCLTLRILKRKTKNFGIRPRFQPQLSISNTNKEIIDRASDILTRMEASHSRKYRDRNVPNTKRQYELIIFSGGLRILIPKLKKLACKAPEAEILGEAIKLCEENQNTGFEGGWGRAPTSSEKLRKFDELRSKLMALHGRQAAKLLKIKAEDLDLTEKQIEVARVAAYDSNPKVRARIMGEMEEPVEEELPVEERKPKEDEEKPDEGKEEEVQ